MDVREMCHESSQITYQSTDTVWRAIQPSADLQLPQSALTANNVGA